MPCHPFDSGIHGIGVGESYDTVDEREPAARIIWEKPSGPISQLAVGTPPISAPMIPSKAASLPVRYKFRIGQAARSRRWLSPEAHP